MQIEYHRRGADAGIYAAAIRESSAATAAMTASAWAAAQVIPFGDQAQIVRRSLPVVDQAEWIEITDEDDTTTEVIVARRGRAVIVINTTGLPSIDGGEWPRLLEPALAAILESATDTQ